jgi:hypothetical protein
MLNGRFGLTIHQQSGAWPSQDEQVALGVNYLRVLVENIELFDQQLTHEVAPGVKVIALINPQTPGVNLAEDTEHDADNVDGWAEVLQAFADRFEGRVDAVECLNEWDDGEKNTPEQAARCAVEAGLILSEHGIKCLLGSVSGRFWPSQLRQAMEFVDAMGGRELLAGACFHPYGRPANSVPPSWEAPEIDPAVRTAHGIAGLPIWITEYGLPLDPEDDGAEQADFLRESIALLSDLDESVLGVACYFSWSDRSGGNDGVYGLVRPDEPTLFHREGWGVYAEAAGGTGVIPTATPVA